LLENELKDKPWYIYNGFSGTSEERNLVDFLKDTMGNFEAKYEKVFLLRNEEVYKIFDFEKGRGFQPDFLLFLKSSQEEIYYQVFIEPKGSQFEDASGNFKEGKEGWKETFLQQITDKYNKETTLKVENHFYKLVGLPLYNTKNNQKFKMSVSENLILEI
jgi:type III restriction enzyme